jgi:hypothetical protein
VARIGPAGKPCSLADYIDARTRKGTLFVLT